MPTLDELQKDQGFMSATPADQIKFLSETDPSFKAAHPDEQAAFLAHATKQPTGAEPYAPAKDVSGAMDVASEHYEKGKGILSGLGRAAAGVPQMGKMAYHAVVDAPKDEEEQAAENVGSESPLGRVGGRASLAAKRMLLDPSIASTEHVNEMAQKQEDKAKAEGGEVPLQGKIAKYAGRGLAAVPMVGPYALNLGERAGKGDVSGALAEGAAYALAPEALHEAMPGGALPGAAAEGARPFPTVDATVRGTGTALRTLGEKAPDVGAVIGGAAGAMKGNPASAYFEMKGGHYAGKMLGKPLEKAGTALEGYGQTPEAKAVSHLEREFKKATNDAQTAQTEYDAYAAGRQNGIPAPKSVLDAHAKAQTHLQLITEHLRLAKEAAEAKNAPASAADQPMTLTPEQQAAQAEKPTPTKEENDAKLSSLMEKAAPTEKTAPVAENVKTPGQVQPETFPQEPTAAPVVDETTAMRPLAGNKGVMVGRKPLMLGEGTPEAAPAAPVAPKTPLGEVLPPEKPTKPGRLGTLKVSEGGKVVDAEEPLQRKIEEGLQGKAKPFAVPPEHAAIHDALSKIEAERPTEEQKPLEALLSKHETPKEDKLNDKGQTMGFDFRPAEDLGNKVRGDKEAPRTTERRAGERNAEADAMTPAFSKARKELGESASFEQIEARAKELQAGREPGLLSTEKELKNEGISPEDLTKVQDVMSQHSDQDLIRLAKKNGIDTDKYDFAKRDANRHRVERDQLVKDLLEKLPEGDKTNIARLSDEFNKKDTTIWSEAERTPMSKAQRARAIMQEHEGGPKPVSGGSQAAAIANTEKGSEQDTDFFAQAKKENPSGSASDWAKEAQKLKDKDQVSVGTQEKPKVSSPTAETYRKVLDASPTAATLTDATAEQLEKYKRFKINTGEGQDAYFSIAPDGEISGLVNNGKSMGVIKHVVSEALKNGGKYLSIWDTNKGLINMYKKFGFEPTQVEGFDADTYGPPSDALKEAWKKQGWKGDDNGPYPSVQYMDAPKTEPKGVHVPGEAESDEEMARRGADAPKPTSENVKLSDAELLKKGYTQADIDAGAHLPSVSGGAPSAAASKKMLTGEELIKKYGESSGDPAHTAFILPDGRGVDLPAGAVHDEMLGGRTDDKMPPREAFIDQGNIRIRPRSGKGGREFAISIPESGITEDQLAHLKKMAPQMGSGTVVVEVGKPGGEYRQIEYGKASDQLEKTLRDLAPIKNAKGSPVDEFGNPTVSGGSPSASAKTAETKLPKLAEQHLLPEEKEGVSKSPQQLQRFVDRMAEMPKVKEWTDAAIAGAGERKWYQRSNQAFDAMSKEAPNYFDQEGDRDKFIGLTAAGSPQQAVVENMKEALRVWTTYVDAGRPTGAALEKLLGQSKVNGGFTLPEAKIPNAMKALAGEPMWPDITKNSNFKVPSFRDNLAGMLHRVTNDGWMALFSGLEAKDISSAHSYHPISVMTRAAADELGWEPAEAQAAIWAFIKTLTEKGTEAAKDPTQMRMYSEDFADIMRHDHETRALLKDMGVTHAELDKRLDAIERKPEPDTSGGRPSAESSLRSTNARVEKLRGKGAIPASKSTGLLNFGESGGDEATDFNPEKLEAGKGEVKVTPLSERPNKTILSVKVDGERAGQMSMTPTPELGKDTMEVSTSQLGTSFRGQGHGSEMYNQAIEYAKSKGVKTLYSDDQVSTKADNVWQSLVRKGTAKWDSTTKRYKISISPLGKIGT